MARKLSVSHQIEIYTHYRESIIHDKETEDRQCEQRIVFFLALVTVVFGILTNFATKGQSSENLTYVSLACGFVLFLYGLLTFSRVVWRSRNIVRHNDALRNIEKKLEDLDPSVGVAIKPPDQSSVVISRTIDSLQGTFAQYLYVTECLLASVCVYLITEELHWPLFAGLTCALLVAIGVFCVLFSWSRRMRTIP
jgi:hypothetical protein